MKKNIPFLYFLTFSIITSFSLAAQQVANEKGSGTIDYLSDSSAAIYYREAKANGFLLREGMPQNFNQLQLGYNYGNGKFVPAQGSTKSQQQYLHTEGKTVLSGIQLWGSFQLDKTREDSTHFGHQTRNNTTTPYYFASPAYNSYRRNVYTLNALGEKYLLKDNLPFILGADYRIGSHYSVNDPRAQINDFQFNLNSGFGYNIAKKLLIGANFMHGYGQERFNIGYKNSTYYESTLYPEYNNYIMNGYAEPIPKLEDRKYQNNRTRNGIDITFKYKLDTINSLVFVGGTQKEKQRSEYISDAISDTLSEYDLTNKTIGVLWMHEGKNSHFIANVKYVNIDGKDRNFTYNGLNNYIYNSAGWNASLSYSIRKKRNILNAVLHITKKEEERVDGSFANKVRYENWLIQPSIGVFSKMNNKNTWGMDLSPYIGFSTSGNILKISSSSNGLFTNGLIYHDYLFNTASYWGAKLSGNYTIAYSNGVQVGIKCFVGYTAYTKLKDIGIATAQLPGKSRWDTGLSLCFYF